MTVSSSHVVNDDGRIDVPVDVRVQPSGRGRVLVVSLVEPHEVLSWAIVNGGRRRADSVVWREVSHDELGPEVDARAVMSRTLEALGAPTAVGLLTGCDLRRFEETMVERDGVRARCIATVGLGNALAVGDPPALAPATGNTVGTINLLCQVSIALTDEALIEACALAAEARTAALLGAEIPSPVSGRPATGTGTDCIVVAAPVAVDGAAPYAGKHTACGSAVGAAVYEAVARGARCWRQDRQQQQEQQDQQDQRQEQQEQRCPTE